MEPITFKFSNIGIDLYGIDNHQSIEKVLDEFARISSKKNPGVKIVLTHSNITDSNTRLTDFTYNQLSKFDIDVIGCGHWHLSPTNGAIQSLNNTWFLNPWNLTRVARDYQVRLDEHRPEFIHASIIMVGNEPSLEFKEVFLNVGKYSEVFRIDVIDLLHELGKTGFDFFKDIKLETDSDLNNDDMLLETIAKSHEINQNSIKIAKELLC